MKYLVLVVSLLVCGCGMQRVKIDIPVNRVGVIVDVSSDLVCHNYVGFTVFNNKTNRLSLGDEFSAAVKQTIVDELKKKNKEVIEIPYREISVGGELLTKPSGGQKVLEIALDHYKSIVDKHGIDAVVAYVNHPEEREEKCSGAVSVNGGTYGVFASGGSAVLLTNNGDFSDQYYLYGKINNSPVARQPRSLTKWHLETANEVMLETLSNDISKKFN